MLSQNVWAAGKAGLWTMTTTWQFDMRIVPPAIAALVRQQKLVPPTNGRPFIHYMCMTGAEADGSEPLHFNNRDLDCVNRTVSTRGSAMVVASVCHGPLEYQLHPLGLTQLLGHHPLSHASFLRQRLRNGVLDRNLS